MSGDRSLLRPLAYAMAGLFVIAALIQLADQLNLFHQPPDIPASANLVDRALAQIPYRQAEWPIFFAANTLVGIGFLVLIGLALVLARWLPSADGGRALVLWTLVTAGILGAIGQLVIVGAVRASIDIPYCDCGFKSQEIVSQVWAEMVVQGAAALLIDAASILAALGLVVAGRAFVRVGMPAAWGSLSIITAALLIVTVVLGYADVGGDLTGWLTLLASGVLIPIWAVWLGRKLPALDPVAA
jgi:hypothetical protein